MGTSTAKKTPVAQPGKSVVKPGKTTTKTASNKGDSVVSRKTGIQGVINKKKDVKSTNSAVNSDTTSDKIAKKSDRVPLNDKKSSAKHSTNQLDQELSARQIAASANITFNEFGLTGSSVPVPGTPGAPGFTPPSMLRKMTAKSSIMDLNCELSRKSEADRQFTEQMKEDEDKLVLMVRDAFWIHVYWNVRHRTQERVRAALGPDWHYAKPALRLFEVRPNDGFNSRRALRNIEIHPKAGNWFIDLDGISASYQIELGYITDRGKFFTVLTSNTVTTPSADTVKGFDAGYEDDEVLDEYERKMNFREISSSEEAYHIREMIDDQRKKIGAAAFAKSAKMDRMPDFDDKGFPFHIDAKALIHGKTLPGAHVTVRGYPIIVDEDGEFLMRVELPDKRQIFPIVASSGDGIQQRTIVLSLERITRFLEPVYCAFDDNLSDY